MTEPSEDICVVVGASHSGAQFVISLRQGGWSGRIILIGEEHDLPYHRPPLSKDFLSGDKSLDEILLRPQSVYEKADVELRLGARVETIDRKNKTVEIQSGETFSYSKLVLATGARVRKLPVPGAELDGVFYLRDTRDVLAIKDQVKSGNKAVIIGGGYIGLETAASLRKQGMEVSVLEAMPRILQRVTAPDLSIFYKRVHTEEGVQILESVGATEIQRTDKGLCVVTDGGEKLDADIVVIGIGVIPNSDLAKDAGLKVGNGIEVDENARTDDPDIYAIGDVTWHYNPIYDRHIRLESVPNATEQAKTAAASINGAPKPYNSLPWFWSDQFDLKLQIAGLSQGYDSVVIRGDMLGSRSFAAFYFKGDKLLAVDAVNRPREFMLARQVLSKGLTLNKAILDDEGADLKATIVQN
jgi:3-phenylpropionate/trans-cinnamate dioxygenase ferredoxin reductase subunit